MAKNKPQLNPKPEKKKVFSIYDFAITIIVFIISTMSFFRNFGEPNMVVFDEVHFGNFTNYYINKQYFFDIHPPLGKLLLYFGSKLNGYNGSLKFTRISQEFENDDIKKIRIWPMIAASLISPILYLTLRANKCSYLWSIVGSLFPPFDNAFIVESRFVLIDAFLWLFAISAILFASITFLYEKPKLVLVIITGLFCGATVSIKFTGGGVFLGVIFGFLIQYPFKKAVYYSFIAGISGLFVFFLSFYMHFMILTNAGPGCYYHEKDFCEKLSKRSINKFVSTISLIIIMLTRNFSISTSHPYSSKWWQWPLQLGYGNYMWVSGHKSIWCFGSPAVWLFSFSGLIIYLMRKQLFNGTIWLFFMYLFSYLPFALVKRVMWIYHYIIPLQISIIISIITFNSFNSVFMQYIMPGLVLSVVISFYIRLSPVTYGFILMPEDFEKITFKWWHY